METLYLRIGGERTVDRITEAHYRRVMADPRLARFFEGLDMNRQIAKFRRFLHAVSGGPFGASPIELRSAHCSSADKGLTDEHFDAFVKHFKDALADAGINSTCSEEMLRHIEGARRNVLDR